jgi:hypothetical protein
MRKSRINKIVTEIKCKRYDVPHTNNYKESADH